MDDFEKKMEEKIALYSNERYLDAYMNHEYMTDDKDADIFLHIEDRNELFDSRTVGRQIELNDSIYDFIDKKTSMLDSNIQIELHITGIQLDSHEQGIVRHILKEHYAIELYKAQKDYVFVRNQMLKLMCIGLASFILYTILFLFTDNEFGVEILGFFFSFALWEGLDSWIYDYHETKKYREDVTQNLLINISFENEEKENS